MRRRITVDLDDDLLRRVDESAALEGMSRNQCIVESLVARVQEIRRKSVDTAFEAMAGDPEYTAQMQALEAEMAHLSDEAWRVAEPSSRPQAPPRRGPRRR